MILNISYRDQKVERQITEQLGKSFGLLERLQLRGVGSQRFHILHAHSDITEKIGSIQGQMYANIELRPRGIMLYFRSRTETFALLIPYYTLSVFKNGHDLSIHSGGRHVALRPANKVSLDPKFYRKMMDLKLSSQCSDCGL
ncbi:MAG: hypothetical protein HKN39_08710 [Flavobacteriales bacterium]|nr:hypothetical protein [Flavobacteriales bacterium]